MTTETQQFSLEVGTVLPRKPAFGLVYGPPLTGKSFLCAKGLKSPFLLALDDSGILVQNQNKSVKKFISNGRLTIPANYQQFSDMLGWFWKKSDGEQRNFQKYGIESVIIDNGTSLQSLIEAEVIAKKPEIEEKGKKIKVESVADYRFGEGYKACFELWKQVIVGIQKLQRCGLDVVMICHSINRNRTMTGNPDDNYKYIVPWLPEYGEVNIPSYLASLSNFTLFIESQTQTKTVKGFMGKDKKIAYKGAESEGELSDLNKPDILLYTRSTNRFYAGVRTMEYDNVNDVYSIDTYDESSCQRVFNDVLYNQN